MSVYTSIERDELVTFLASYPVSELQGFEGISAGIENTNYFVTTRDGEYVLTLFEWLSWEELPYFLDLMAFLNEHSVPSAHPLADNDGRYLRTLKNKPAALVQRLPGTTVSHPTPEQCRALGSALGHLHAVGREFSGQRENDRGTRWRQETAKRLYPKLGGRDASLLRDELLYQSQHGHPDLPKGVIHADLFRDNALFVGDKLTGIIDFYYACNDQLLYDVAVTVNDWCSDADGALDEERATAVLTAYAGERSFTTAEREMWAFMLRAAALRFWLSRLQDMHFPKEGEITHIKDPDVFKNILLQRINNGHEIRLGS
jgi:homoserine kinase type II